MEAKEMQEQLDNLKSALETSLSKKAKEEITTQIKEVSTQIEALKASIPSADTETPKLVKSLEDQLKEVKAAAELNQPVIDAFVAAQKKSAPAGPVTFNDAFREAVEKNSDEIEKIARKDNGRNQHLIIPITKVVGDMTTGNVTGGTRYGEQYRNGIIENPKRKVHVRELTGVAPAGPGNTYTFMRENGQGEGAIAPTAETSTKPQIDLDLIETTVNFETIAGWLRVTRKAMRNIPGLIAFLQSRLPEKLLRAEDAQLLQGDGVSPNISGIMDSGNFIASTSSATALVEQIIDDIALLEDTYERSATGILLRPVDYFGFFKHKAAGSGEYDLPRNVVFAGGTLYISGIPVFQSTAVPADTRIIGDWDMGAEVLQQEGMRLEFFEQDGTNVRENKVTVRIEETIAFPIYGPDYFIVGTNNAS